MWEEHLESYGLLGARVIPYSMADKKLPELKRFNLVICDVFPRPSEILQRLMKLFTPTSRRNSSKVSAVDGNALQPCVY